MSKKEIFNQIMARVPQETEKRISYEFRLRLLSIIAEKDITKENFAIESHVNKEIITRATVYGIIPSVRSLVKIANYLNFSIPYLLAETDDKTFYMSEHASNFKIRFEELKHEFNVKDCEILKAMSCPANSLSEWRRNDTIPSLQYLKEIASFFDVSIDYMLGRTDYKK